MMRRRTGFVGLLIATTVSLVGSRMTTVALPWLILVATGSAARTGVVAAAELVPYVAACALIGPVIDRIGSRRMSVAGDAVSAVVVASIPFLFHEHDLGFLALVGLVMAAGGLRGIGDTAKHGAMFPQTVAESGIEMTRATSLIDGSSRAASMVGALLAGGLIYWLGGAANVLYLDAFSFFVCAVLVGGLVRVSGRVEPRADDQAAAGSVQGSRAQGSSVDERKETYWTALRSGVRYMVGERLILGLTLMLLVTNMMDQAYSSVLVPLWAHNIFGSPLGIGLLSASFGIGAIVGNIAFTALAPRLPRWAPYTFGFIVIGGPRFVVLAMGGHAWLLVVTGLVNGLAVAAINPILSAVLYERIPEHMQARVNGIGMAISSAGMPAGALLAGWLGEYGTRFALLTVGALYFLATLAPLFGRFWRDMDIRAVPNAPAELEPSLV